MKSIIYVTGSQRKDLWALDQLNLIYLFIIVVNLFEGKCMNWFLKILWGQQWLASVINICRALSNKPFFDKSIFKNKFWWNSVLLRLENIYFNVFLLSVFRSNHSSDSAFFNMLNSLNVSTNTSCVSFFYSWILVWLSDLTDMKNWISGFELRLLRSCLQGRVYSVTNDSCESQHMKITCEGRQGHFIEPLSFYICSSDWLYETLHHLQP